MKKIITLMVIIGLLVGCSKPKADLFDSNELQEKSKTIFTYLIEGKYDEVYNSMSDYCKKQVTADILKNAWEPLQAELKEYNGIYEVKDQIDNNKRMAIVEVVGEFKEKGAKLTLTYNEKLQIEGIYIAPAYINKSLTLENNELFYELEIEIGETNPVKGKITLPKNSSNVPVAILIQGSGASDMDETIGTANNKPFRDIAYGLAKEGIASIRFDKRTYAYANEMAALGNKLTIHEEVVNDVNYAVEFAKNWNTNYANDITIDVNQIYLIGHSLGGMLAPTIAYNNDDVAGFVSMAGTLRGLEDVILDQNRNVLQADSSLTKEEVDSYMKLILAEIEKVKQLTKDDGSMILNIPSAYWMSLNEMKAETIIGKIAKPMLILQGDKDFQVFADVDFKLWKDTVKSENAEFILYSDLNHMFMPSTKQDITDYNIPNNVSVKVIEDISRWIHTNEKK